MEDVWLICVLCVIMFDRAAVPGPCDTGTFGNVREGNVGESAYFPWHGVLRVNLHEGSEVRVALTGLVLVKDRYAVANADDVAKIPKLVFKTDSKAMFIPKTENPWYTMLIDYVTHPEYETFTYNTIAIVELAVENKIPFHPICWPGNFFNTSNQLYAIGYTDDNTLLEKTMYKLQYVEPSLCNEFYDRAQLSDPKMTPTHIQCGYAVNNKLDCLWENGMALASNSTGRWTLVGLSVRGPSCSAPARFIDLFPYLPWIESTTDPTEDVEYPEYRRSAFGEGFRRQKNDKKQDGKQNIPLLLVDNVNYRSSGLGEDDPPGLNYKITRRDDDEINIVLFDEVYEEEPGDCSKYKDLAYRDQVRVEAKLESVGNVTYRVSLYDLYFFGYQCVNVRVNSPRRSKVSLWYRLVIPSEEPLEKDELQTQDIDDLTPPELYKHQVINRREPTTERNQKPKNETWKPGPHLTAVYITDRGDRHVRNLNLYLWFVYVQDATLEVKVYGSTESEAENVTANRRLYQSYYPDASTTASNNENIHKLQEETDESITTTNRPIQSIFRLHHTNKKKSSENKPDRPTLKTTVRRRKLRNPRYKPSRWQKAMIRQAERMAMKKANMRYQR